MLQKILVFYKKLRLRNLISNMDYDQPEFHVIKSLLQNEPGTTIDAGASFGVYSVFMSRYCRQVYAFEPVPLSFSILSDQLKRNLAKNVVAHQSALSDRAGKREMKIPKLSGTHNYYRAGFNTENQANYMSVEVNCTTLDDFSESIDNCSFIKIDVEGHEHSVIQGGIETIKAYKPSLLIEMNDPESADSKSVTNLLTSLGYHQYFLNSSNKYEEWSGASESNSVNHFFLQSNHVEYLKKMENSVLK